MDLDAVATNIVKSQKRNGASVAKINYRDTVSLRSNGCTFRFEENSKLKNRVVIKYPVYSNMGENSKQITKGKFFFIYFYAPGPEKFNVSFSEKKYVL